MILAIILGALLWWFVGFTGFVFWWTSQYALTVTDLPVAIAAGLIGPFAWVAGYYVHGRPSCSSRILIEKRQK